MGKQDFNYQTALQSEEVILKAVHFFTDERYRVQTQAERTVIFALGFELPLGSIVMFIGGVILCATLVGAIIGVPLLIIGVISVAKAKSRVRGSRGALVITTAPIKEGAEITITYPPRAFRTSKLVKKFVETLPKKS